MFLNLARKEEGRSFTGNFTTPAFMYTRADSNITQFGDNGDDYFIAEIIRRKGKEEREQLLHDMGLTGQMTEEQGLAMMVDMSATWNLMRKLRR